MFIIDIISLETNIDDGYFGHELMIPSHIANQFTVRSLVYNIFREGIKNGEYYRSGKDSDIFRNNMPRCSGACSNIPQICGNSLRNLVESAESVLNQS